MIQTVNFEGVKATVQNLNFRAISILSLMIGLLFISSCSNNSTATNSGPGQVDPNETAATVNGKAIKLEEVERALKQESRGMESKFSPLELAAARLRILEQLIQQEVLFQKAEKEGTVPNEQEIVAQYNQTRTQSGMTQEQWDKMMTESGQTEVSAKETIKRSLAIKKLIENITGKIEPVKESEIEAFYNGNKDAFVKKKGVKLAAIVIDPANAGEGDQTKDEQSAVIRGNEIIKELQQGADFATVAREKSEDQSKFQGGDLGYIAEEQLKQTFPPNVVATMMNPEFKVGQIIPAQAQGKFYILKLQERSDKDEDLTLESPGVRQRVTEELINARKELLSQSYAAVAMNEAKIENLLAQKVVNNPNELSGARPASVETPAAANTNTNVNAAAANTNANSANTTNTAANANKANKAVVNTGK